VGRTPCRRALPCVVAIASIGGARSHRYQTGGNACAAAPPGSGSRACLSPSRRTVDNIRGSACPTSRSRRRVLGPARHASDRDPDSRPSPSRLTYVYPRPSGRPARAAAAPCERPGAPGGRSRAGRRAPRRRRSAAPPRRSQSPCAVTAAGPRTPTRLGLYNVNGACSRPPRSDISMLHHASTHAIFFYKNTCDQRI